MPYLRRTEAQPLTPDTVESLARLVGLTIPPEDVAPLARALTDQLASIDLLDRLDLAGVDPVLDFDPRWPETHSAPDAGAPRP
jgi:hypothetical protein